MQRQQATAKSRSFRCLSRLREALSIATGSVQASHSASVTVVSPFVPSVVEIVSWHSASNRTGLVVSVKQICAIIAGRTTTNRLTSSVDESRSYTIAVVNGL
jgi:hypothetical protein